MENEVKRIKALPDSLKYIKYLKHLNEIVVDCKKDYKNELMIYKTQNGIFDYGSKKAGKLVSPAHINEINATQEKSDDNPEFVDPRFYDRPYIDLE